MEAKSCVGQLELRISELFDAVERGERPGVSQWKPFTDIVRLSETPSWKRRAVQPLVVKGVSMSAEILRDRVQSRA
jgi:hypothetical protein